jgi:pSer/pThr/pTyr-binding forkhead associated (FHA) protein
VDTYLEVSSAVNGGRRHLVADRLVVGRSPLSDVVLPADAQVSRTHAVLERIAGRWVVRDVGSRNGTYVNGERIHGRRRLRDGDMLRFGSTIVAVHNQPSAARRTTLVAIDRIVSAADLSEQQRKVLIALCRPFRDDPAFESPPTNQQLADQLYLSVAAVKLHLRALFEKFDIPDLPQNKKRLALVRSALQSGIVTDRELGLADRAQGK